MSTTWPTRVGRALVAGAFTLLAARTVVIAACTPEPPALSTEPAVRSAHRIGSVRRVGASWVREHHGILRGYLQGTPEEIGAAHARLLRDEMVRNEVALWGVFERTVPSWPLRTMVTDLARVRFASVDEGMGYARRLELAAAARAFQPDPFSLRMPTYARFVLLNALYDVALSFEHSPLIGCSSVFVRDPSGAPLLARNFDFEAHEVFDRGKSVLVFAESGKTPVLSVAWPGLAGVVTGMNAGGVAAVVHGARAGEPSASGQPVLLGVREALGEGRTADEVAAWLAARDPMVSHVVLVADAAGGARVVERVPGREAHVRSGALPLALTNHLEGPSARDPKNDRVRETTSTVARRARLDVILSEDPAPTERDLMAVLRDRRDVDGRLLPPGDRRAIDADIATHGVVMNLRTRTVWVSQGPHLSGQFVRIGWNEMTRP